VCSLGAWPPSPLGSANGTSGDGVITPIIAVVLGGVTLATGGHFVAELLTTLTAGGVGIYDFIQRPQRSAHATFGGIQVAGVGWGLYVVIIGAALALGGLLKTRLQPWEM
jgi:hypothetical protein